MSQVKNCAIYLCNTLGYNSCMRNIGIHNTFAKLWNVVLPPWARWRIVCTTWWRLPSPPVPLGRRSSPMTEKIVIRWKNKMILSCKIRNPCWIYLETIFADNIIVVEPLKNSVQKLVWMLQSGGKWHHSQFNLNDLQSWRFQSIDCSYQRFNNITPVH